MLALAAVFAGLWLTVEVVCAVVAEVRHRRELEQMALHRSYSRYRIER